MRRTDPSGSRVMIRRWSLCPESGSEGKPAVPGAAPGGRRAAHRVAVFLGRHTVGRIHLHPGSRRTGWLPWVAFFEGVADRKEAL